MPITRVVLGSASLKSNFCTDATITEVKHLKHAVKLLETHQEQRDMLSDEEIKDICDLNTDNQIDKDALLFEAKFHKGVKKLVKRKKLCSGEKHKKLDYENYFKRLESRGIGSVEEKKHLTTQNVCISRKKVFKKLPVILKFSMNSQKMFLSGSMVRSLML